MHFAEAPRLTVGDMETPTTLEVADQIAEELILDAQSEILGHIEYIRNGGGKSPLTGRKATLEDVIQYLEGDGEDDFMGTLRGYLTRSLASVAEGQ